MKINLNTLAREITLEEGLKKNMTIAQVKEMLKITLRSLKKAPLEDLMSLLSRIK